MMTNLLSQGLAIAADGIHPASNTTGTYLTSAVDCSKFRQLLFIVDVGTLGGSATIDFQVYGSATSGGSYTAISGTSITQIATTGKYALVLVQPSKIAASSLNYAFIKGQITIGTATSIASCIVLGSDARFEPTSGLNAAAVVQVVNYATT